MKLILTKDVPDLGQKGDVVDVADGYARNYLVPRSLAVKASTGAVRMLGRRLKERLVGHEKRSGQPTDSAPTRSEWSPKNTSPSMR